MRITWGKADGGTGVLEIPTATIYKQGKVAVNKRICYYSRLSVKVVEHDTISSADWLGDCDLWSDDTAATSPCMFTQSNANYGLTWSESPTKRLRCVTLGTLKCYKQVIQ